ncbi:MAG: hypothetical protein GX605_03815 [Chloroflexi bacterium]|nr:hypothetical protein [Chloroflexota bacterium]
MGAALDGEAVRRRLQAAGVAVADDVALGPGVDCRVGSGSLAAGVRLGAGSRVVCRRLEMAEGSQIGAGVELVANEVRLGPGARIGDSTQVTVVERLHLGRASTIGPHCQVAGRRIEIGESLWTGEHVLIGGGGAMSPQAVLTMGNGCLLVDYVYVNLADAVEIGDETALSYHVTVLTHGVWQPILEGYKGAFGPVRIGSQTVVYTHSTVLPGVTIGDGVTVGACSLVRSDIPARSFAAGVPARVIRDADHYPQRLTSGDRNALVLGVLERYLATLPYKGIQVLQEKLQARGEAVVQGQGGSWRLVFVPAEVDDAAARLQQHQAECAERGQQLLGVSLSPAHPVEGAVILDLHRRLALGRADVLAEDLRDHLRRSGIRILSDRPFRGLRPQALQDLLQWAEDEGQAAQDETDGGEGPITDAR